MTYSGIAKIVSYLMKIIAVLVQIQSGKEEIKERHSNPDDDLTGGELKFDHARRIILWRGGFCDLHKRKRRRYDFVSFMWDRVGEYVTTEELAAVLFDRAHWKWNSIKRYGNRLQQDDLGPSGCPFFLREETEGFTLLPLF